MHSCSSHLSFLYGCGCNCGCTSLNMVVPGGLNWSRKLIASH